MTRTAGQATTQPDPVVRARVDPILKQQATAILDGFDVSVSDVLREVLVRVVRDRTLPFAVRTRTGVVDPALRRALINDALPELHKAHWEQRQVELEAAIDAETDPVKSAELERQAAAHFANRFKPESSRDALNAANGVSKKRGSRR